MRTVAQALESTVVDLLELALVWPIQDVTFELVPLLSTPCDLYSLGVMGVRTLLVEGGRTLAVALDELLSLGRELSGTDKDELLIKMEALFRDDPRWNESLGALAAARRQEFERGHGVDPARTVAEGPSVLKMFTGLFSFSHCKDLGDAPPGGAHLSSTRFWKSCTP